MYRIESYRLLLYYVHHCRFIRRWSKGVKATVTRPPRTHACVLFYGPWYGRGLKGREAEGDCNLIPASPWRAVLVLATITPHFLHQQEVCVANGLHVPPIAYKLRSLSDLPGLILQVAGTATHGVLVSVSVSAIVYTRILVSDRIGVCPYRSFSSRDFSIGLPRYQSTLKLKILTHWSRGYYRFWVYIFHIICVFLFSLQTFVSHPHSLIKLPDCQYTACTACNTWLSSVLTSRI